MAANWILGQWEGLASKEVYQQLKIIDCNISTCSKDRRLHRQARRFYRRRHMWRRSSLVSICWVHRQPVPVLSQILKERMFLHERFPYVESFLLSFIAKQHMWKMKIQTKVETFTRCNIQQWHRWFFLQGQYHDVIARSIFLGSPSIVVSVMKLGRDHSL